MLTISLKEFALTGEFGPVKIGMHKDEAIALLGKPGCESDFGRSITGGFLYGWYEFFYDNDTREIHSIQNDHLQADCLNHGDMFLYQNSHFRVDTWFLKAGQDFAFQDVINILHDEKIPFRIVRRLGEDREMIEFKSGVLFSFNERCDTKTGEVTGEMVLFAINHCPLHHVPELYEVVYQSGE
ncbi:hypothetical protein Pan241w_02110 [Gimesia alba]|uniref:Uncharacterized protein n=1 Tax=Gimesia alba TaxID=2527973 RepID=A0A517R8F5_9PLAN|nr:hypothetical protein [Gimesia alba]QDT40155.1 hypothetical protein Pan241w_02110 [Gimesia alba]